MKPIDVQQRLDDLGVVDESHGPGIYALAAAVPNTVEAVQRTWLNAIDAPLPDEMAEQLAAAETCLYIGRSGDVYGRLMDHADGQVRRASFIRAFGMADVRGVWGDDKNSGVAERNRARALSGPTTVVWTDGSLF